MLLVLNKCEIFANFVTQVAKSCFKYARNVFMHGELQNELGLDYVFG